MVAVAVAMMVPVFVVMQVVVLVSVVPMVHKAFTTLAAAQAAP